MVTCAKCGYLTLLNIETQELEGVGFEGRAEGGPTMRFDSGQCEMRPICLRLHPSLAEETTTADGTEHRFAEIIHADRNCDAFMEWRQGFTPKEHFEMDMQSRLLIDQHAWQAEQSLLADKRHDQSMKIAMDSMKTAMRGAYLGAIATILASALAVWATFKGQSPPPTVNVVIPPASATK